ncbi:DUF1028 domain-containing protein [Acidimangrovimonas sediminis]|uniref:DUF1028 domain-containing protein n=1 Tax=Acidimangrovimonas sediminis TaxID=2056283 RepID=UPI000C7FF0A3|nr:DUF1028 domain-containing protein [Acidimangrovimonas sediminis]
MTFSIIARCAETGAFGAAITTSDLAVGGRCVRLAHGRGAFLSQHRTDSRLGDLGISLLTQGMTAEAAITEVSRASPEIEWRQLGALDGAGRAAAFHGRRMYSIYAHATAPDCLALGNILANEEVPAAMATGFAAAAGQPLAERLMRALEAGRDAGGEILGPLRSAALRVTGDHGIDACDLRVDISAACAVADLRALHEAYGDRREALRRVALIPDTVPVQRALFEASLERIAERGLGQRFTAAQHPDSWTVAP